MARDHFSDKEIDELHDAIKHAEEHSSGEIRLHLEYHCNEDVMDRAAFLFEQLEMHKTELRNGVLFYLAIKDHKYAILGDVGINQKVPKGFWNEVSEHMQEKFKQGDIFSALNEGIRMSGEKLTEYFPLSDDDQNELSNEISFGE